MSDSESPRRNGSVDVRVLLQWLPLVAIVFSAGITYKGYEGLSAETSALRLRSEQHSTFLAEQGRAQAVLEGRVSRGESDQRALMDRLERIDGNLRLMNERFVALCTALDKPCQP